MKLITLIFFLFTVSIFILCSCEDIQKYEAKVAFNLRDSGKDTVRIYRLDPFNGSRINNQELILDSLGTGSKSLSTPDLEFLTMEVGGERFPISILLETNDDITIKGSKKDLLNTIEFEGKGSIPNNLRINVSRIYRKFDKVDGKLFFQLDSAEFEHRISSVNREISNYINEYSLKNKLPEDLQELLLTESMLMSKAITLNYHLVNNQIQKSETIKIPWDTTLLKAGSPEYYATLSFYQDLEIVNPLWEASGAGLSDSVKYQFPQLVYNSIQSSEIAAKIKEFLIARYLFSYHLSSFDITPVSESIFYQWKELYPNSEYLKALENTYNQNQRLALGTIAPEIKGVTAEGDSLYLSSLKGKIIYIDVWATWCKPCIEQFPAAKQLQHEFIRNEKVAFLNVSVDKDFGKWQKFLSKNQFGGININSSDGKILEDYMLSGVPQYIIIDQNGKIIKTNAPKPSSGKVKEEILKLIEQGS